LDCSALSLKNKSCMVIKMFNIYTADKEVSQKIDQNYLFVYDKLPGNKLWTFMPESVSMLVGKKIQYPMCICRYNTYISLPKLM